MSASTTEGGHNNSPFRSDPLEKLIPQI